MTITYNLGDKVRLTSRTYYLLEDGNAISSESAVSYFTQYVRAYTGVYGRQTPDLEITDVRLADGEFLLEFKVPTQLCGECFDAEVPVIAECVHYHQESVAFQLIEVYLTP